MYDPKLQAFAEDLAAVFAKHDTRISCGYDYPCVQEFYGYERFVVINASHDICFVEDTMKDIERRRYLACAEIPTSAHARLAAAARVACLTDHDGRIEDTVERIAEMLDRAAEPGEYGCVSDDMPLEGLVGTIGSPCSHAEFRDLMRPIIDAVRGGKVTP